MLIELGAVFVVGLVFGRGLHHLAHDRCPFVHPITEYGVTQQTCRCTLRVEHDGPHRLRWVKSANLWLSTEWVKNEDDP